MKKESNLIVRQKNKLDRFLMGLVNVTVVTAQIQPLLAVDTTAVFALRQIYAETEYDFSEDGRVLHESADLLLNAVQTVRRSYHQQHRILNNNSYSNIHKKSLRDIPPVNQQAKLSKNNAKVGSCKFGQTLNETDQNRNGDDKKQRKAKVVQLDLKEIIRPEYRRKMQVKTHRVSSEQIEGLNSIGGKDQVWNQTQRDNSFASCWEREDIPLLKNRRKAQVLSGRGQQSKSPKVEGKKHKNVLSNISSISRNYQTQTDQSFQSDLHGMGLFEDKQTENKSSRRSLSTYEGFLNQRRSNGQSHLNDYRQQNNQIAARVFHRYDKSDSGEIQEEQPWQCDEEQVEEELKSINERLTHRGYQSQRFKTQLQTAKQDSNQVQDGHLKYTNRDRQVERQNNVFDRTKKPPKTVRLSLTPIKSKSPIRNVNKKQIRQISIIKTPIIQVADKGKQKYKPYGVNCLIQPQQQQKQQLFECRKWKKPNRGLITVQIQKFAKDN